MKRNKKVNKKGNEKTMRKIVFWKSTLTGEEGHGKPLLPSIAEAWVTYANEKFPDIIHMAVEREIEKFQ